MSILDIYALTLIQTQTSLAEAIPGKMVGHLDWSFDIKKWPSCWLTWCTLDPSLHTHGVMKADLWITSGLPPHSQPASQPTSTACLFYCTETTFKGPVLGGGGAIMCHPVWERERERAACPALTDCTKELSTCLTGCHTVVPNVIQVNGYRTTLMIPCKTSHHRVKLALTEWWLLWKAIRNKWSFRPLLTSPPLHTMAPRPWLIPCLM